MKRRHFLQAGLTTSVLAGAGGISSRAWANTANGNAGGRESAKNVIFLVSDGMSTGTLTMADQYLRWRDDRPSTWVRLLEEQVGRRGLLDMSSADSIVTDSAAAAASWGCGHRINNGALNIDPNGEHREPILMKARDAGKATALVTTTQLTHATPAGFSVNVESRGMGEQIAEQYYEREFDILLGGGVEHFDADRRSDDHDLLGGFADKGYAVVEHQDDLNALPDDEQRVLGVFNRGHLPYELDRVNSDSQKARVPHLADMTRKALAMLEQRDNGFVMQVEGGRVDHAAHSNDVGGLIFDQIAFDEAIAAAVEFAQNRDDTLVIVTTDHGNANPGLNSGGNRGQRNFETLSQFTGTHGPILGAINSDSSADDIRDRVQQVTGIDLSDRQANLLRDRLNNDWRAAYDRMNGTSAVLGQILSNHTDISWIGNSHTSDYVECWAYGPGSEMLKPFQWNIALHNVMADVLGLERAQA